MKLGISMWIERWFMSSNAKDVGTLYMYLESSYSGYTDIILIIFSFIAVICGVLVIISVNPIISVLFLIGLFLSIAAYLISLGINFIGLSYLLVYVGAISILFLFILMLINIRISELFEETNKSIPLSIITAVLFNSIVITIVPYNVYTAGYLNIYTNVKDYLLNNMFNYSVNVYDIYNNILFVTSNSWDNNLGEVGHITSLGNVMYANYSVWLILTSVILLLAMVGAIVITISPSKVNNEYIINSPPLQSGIDPTWINTIFAPFLASILEVARNNTDIIQMFNGGLKISNILELVGNNSITLFLYGSLYGSLIFVLSEIPNLFTSFYTLTPNILESIQKGSESLNYILQSQVLGIEAWGTPFQKTVYNGLMSYKELTTISASQSFIHFISWVLSHQLYIFPDWIMQITNFHNLIRGTITEMWFWVNDLRSSSNISGKKSMSSKDMDFLKTWPYLKNIEPQNITLYPTFIPETPLSTHNMFEDFARMQREIDALEDNLASVTDDVEILAHLQESPEDAREILQRTQRITCNAITNFESIQRINITQRSQQILSDYAHIGTNLEAIRTEIRELLAIPDIILTNLESRLETLERNLKDLLDSLTSFGDAMYEHQNDMR